MSALHAATHCFVVPALDGPVTGGTLYNRELCAALSEASYPIAVRGLEALELGPPLNAACWLWVDSLFLAALPRLRRFAPGRTGLLSHYLPSFVALGRSALPAELSDQERRALCAADAFLVTSELMREAFGPLVAPEKSIFVVSPGSRARLAPVAPSSSRGLRALLIANVLPGKGIEPLLEALAASLRPDDQFSLSIVGSLEADRGYAAGCLALARSAELQARVTFCGALQPEQTAALLAESELLISASAMESYGMALAEARVAGVPISAVSGGNTRAHIDAEAGGHCFRSVPELVIACLELCRSPERVRQRVEQARRRAVPARSWPLAAQQFINQLASLEK